MSSTTTNRELADRARQLAERSAGLQRRAALCASVALGTTGTVGAARNALADVLQGDVRDAAMDLVGQLAASTRSTT
ncbi:MAG: hypothetical protein ACRDOK_01530 [Streptosporangiaceae bacterium]